MSKLYLLSTSEIKKQAVLSLKLINENNLVCVNINDSTAMPPQPVGHCGGLKCAMKRIELFKQSLPLYFDSANDVIVSIENFIDVEKRQDVCCFVIELNGCAITGFSLNDYNPTYPEEYVEELGELQSYDNGNNHGYANTVGSLIHRYRNEIEANNWSHRYRGATRHDQICNACRTIDSISFLKQFIRYVPDHPQKGVMFSDLLPLFTNVVLKNITINLMLSRLNYVGVNFDYIVGLESRGFIFGMALAERLGIGFVPMRKFGKLGGDCYTVSYVKEYGEDKFEMWKSAMMPNKNVLIVDDVLATGGTLNAAKILCDNFRVKVKSTDAIDFGEEKYPEVYTYSIVLCDIEFFREKAKVVLGDFHDKTIICF